MTTPADLVREACDLLAGYVPQLARLTPDPDIAECAAPGMNARPPAAPVPGNPQAFFAYTSIWASARWAEELLLYAAGAGTRDEGERPGGSDANTVRLLTRVIPRLAAGAGDDAFRLVMSELDRRLDEARSVAAIDIDEAQRPRRWRYLRGRPCPYCRCWTLKVLLDAADNPSKRVECHAHPSVRCADGNGRRPAAAMGTDSRGVPGLAWDDGRWEPAPDMDLEG